MKDVSDVVDAVTGAGIAKKVAKLVPLAVIKGWRGHAAPCGRRSRGWLLSSPLAKLHHRRSYPGVVFSAWTDGAEPLRPGQRARPDPFAAR